jgi:hypothetical protein
MKTKIIFIFRSDFTFSKSGFLQVAKKQPALVQEETKKPGRLLYKEFMLDTAFVDLC